MVDTRTRAALPFRLLRFRNRMPRFPLSQSSPNGPRRKGFASPRLAARPWRLRAVLENHPV